MDPASVNFIELVALTRVTNESTVERFGSTINSSFFDASNILATLKQKNLVDFVTSFPSQSTLKLTDTGHQLIGEANSKAAEPLDPLDTSILAQLANGRRGLTDLNTSVNVAQKDMALHLFKLNAQQYISYELVNANMNLYLTEKGFIAVKNSDMQKMQDKQQAADATQQKTEEQNLKELEEKLVRNRDKNKRMMTIVIVIVVILVILILLKLLKVMI